MPPIDAMTTCEGGPDTRSQPSARHPEAVSLEPASAYEAVTRQMVEGLANDLREIKSRLNGMLWMVAGTVLLDVVLRVAGV